MKKIPCLFQRDFTDKRRPVLLREVTPGCEWVLSGEGRATRKWDGTAVMIKGGRIYARLDCKRGRVPPAGAIPCNPEPDPVTGHWPHWIEATRPEDVWHREAFADAPSLPDATYELVGPRVNGNHDHLGKHRLERHGAFEYEGIPRDFVGLAGWLESHSVEGIVFHHPDGRMAKIRRDDFGFPWPLEGT